jgi:CMP-2-keto-3-deoxyoctulosonic acid synthetase
MSAKMKQRRAHNRRKVRVTRRREDALFFGRSEIPASAMWFSICPCGARAFTRDSRDYEFMDDFHAAHSWCDELAS